MSRQPLAIVHGRYIHALWSANDRYIAMTKTTVNHRFLAAAGAALVLTLTACSQQPADCEPRLVAMPDEHAQKLAQLLNEFNPDAFGNLLMDNARLLPPNHPAVEGKAAILEYYGGIVGESIRYEAQQEKLVTVGAVGITEGNYRVRNVPENKYVEMGKYMAVWANESGEWKIARIMVNTDYQTPTTSIDIQPAP